MTVDTTVAGRLERQADGGMLVVAASSNKADHYAAVTLSIPARSQEGSYPLVALAQALDANNTITGYGAVLSREVAGGDTVQYGVTRGDVRWQQTPWALQATFRGEQQDKAVDVVLDCAGLAQA